MHIYHDFKIYQEPLQCDMFSIGYQRNFYGGNVPCGLGLDDLIIWEFETLNAEQYNLIEVQPYFIFQSSDDAQRFIDLYLFPNMVAKNITSLIIKFKLERYENCNIE